MTKTTSGFTIIEVLVVSGIIGAMSIIANMSFSSIQADIRDSERSIRIGVIQESIEKYYSQNGEYPSCDNMSQTASTIASSVLIGIDINVLATPTAPSGTNSILASCADLSGSDDNFAYVGNSACISNTTLACSTYTLRYISEKTDTILSVIGRHGW